jgi:predicted membrane metal-binding protein
MSDHWLARPSTIRLLWRGFIVVLVLTVLTEFGFGAWFGFLACAVLILGAKALGALLKRPDGYYDEPGDD